MALLTYEDARPWARSIKNKVVSRQMPPWMADPGVGVFENDPRLTDADIATIAKWVDEGAPQGDPKDMPTPPMFTDGWQLGEPDHIIELPEVQIPATGGDVFPDSEPSRPISRKIDGFAPSKSVRARARLRTTPCIFATNAMGLLGGNTSGFFDVLGVLGRRHAADGLSRRHGPLGAQGSDAAHQPALPPERHGADRPHANRPLLRQGRAEERSRGRACRQRHLLDPAQRAELRTARRLHRRSGHQRRVALPAHASARERHEDDRDLSQRQAGDAAQRAGLRFQLAALLLPEDAHQTAERARVSIWSRTTTTRRRTRTIRIRRRR